MRGSPSGLVVLMLIELETDGSLRYFFLLVVSSTASSSESPRRLPVCPDGACGCFRFNVFSVPPLPNALCPRFSVVRSRFLSFCVVNSRIFFFLSSRPLLASRLFQEFSRHNRPNLRAR
ncbi:hypothetical protein EV356DRAFT_277119 [Viridothelium virens]|uniref:Uncharacterized protein n=1 Tax=Viridothelium virens TaxID=1048519 RepID=A0A6A6H216_VIRVR|nr:hypothetical protein EV356DRAFT_277119 [Viridothelium virens]